jgi:hypothetical protein
VTDDDSALVRPAVSGQGLWDRPVTAIAAVVVTSAAVAIFAPDLVTGSEHEQLPLAALTVWPWAAAAVGYILLAATRRASRGFVIGVTGVWIVVAVVAIAAPALVTGTDPTRIPLAALIAPPFGAVATGFLAIAHARAGSGLSS